MFFLGRKTLSLIIHFLMLNESIIGRPELETPLEVSFVCSDLLEYMQLWYIPIPHADHNTVEFPHEFSNYMYIYMRCQRAFWKRSGHNLRSVMHSLLSGA